MLNTVRSLMLPLLASVALWCSAGLSHEREALELNLEDGVSDAYAGYWNTFYCQTNPLDPVCASSAPNPYYGPAWYNFNYGGWGFGDGDRHAHRGHDRNHGNHCRGRCHGNGGR